MVGVRGFELLTSCSQSRRATGLRYTPVKKKATFASRLPRSALLASDLKIRFQRTGFKNGGSCGIRTYDQLVKSQLLYQLS